MKKIGKNERRFIKQMIRILPRISDKNLIKIAYLCEKIARTEDVKQIMRTLGENWQNNHPSLRLAKNILGELSKNCLDRLMNNLIIDFGLLGGARRREFAEKEGFMPPSFLLISPTMKCNLNCLGCSTREYNSKNDLSRETIDRIFIEAKEMGIHFVVTLGGETLIRKDIFDIFEKHNDMYFLVYTNGTLINEKMAKKLAKVGNVAPAFSLEGFEKETDHRRGKGVFKKILKAMELCRKEGIFFGFSITATKQNNKLVSSDKFVDFLLEQGCYFGWYFQYIPVGKNPDINLMPTPEQRVYLFNRVKKSRNTKPVFIGDFWGDGPAAGGCLAGGRSYFHINNKGDVEPCGFVHFAVDNIKNKSLKEVLNSDFFRAIRRKQQAITAPEKYSDNLLTPCMIIDQPWVLKEVCERCNAHPTHEGAETIIKDKKIKAHLDKYSKRIHELTDSIATQ